MYVFIDFYYVFKLFEPDFGRCDITDVFLLDALITESRDDALEFIVLDPGLLVLPVIVGLDDVRREFLDYLNN